MDGSFGLTARLARVWDFLTAPSGEIKDPDQQHQSWLLAAMVIVLTSLGLVVAVASALAQDPSEVEVSQLYAQAGIYLIAGVIFGLNRKGHLELAKALIVLNTTAAVFILALLDVGRTSADLKYLLLAILMAGTFYPPKRTLQISAGILLALLVIPFFFQELTLNDVIIEPFGFILLAGGFILVIFRYQQKFQADHNTALKNSQTYYHSLFESMGDAVFTLDPEGVVLDANANAFKLLGYGSKKAFVGTSFLNAIAVSERSKSMALLENILQDKPVPVFEQYLLAKDGTEIPTEVSASLTRDSNGAPSYIQCIVRDVTERKQSQDDMILFHRIDREMGYVLDRDQVLEMAMDTAMRRTMAPAVLVALVDEKTDALQRMAWLGEPQVLNEAISVHDLHNLPQHASMAQALRENKIITVSPNGSSSVNVLIPLVFKTTVFGLMILDRVEQAELLDKPMIQFLTYLARRAAEALNKALVHLNTLTRAGQIESLYEIGQTLANRLERRPIFTLAAAGIVNLLDGSCGFICSYNRTTGELTTEAVHTLPDVPDSVDAFSGVLAMLEYKNLPLSEARAIRIQDSIWTEDDLARLRALNLQGLLIVPLEAATQDDTKTVVGFLGLGESRYNRNFTREEIALARNFSTQVMVALHRARMFASLKDSEQLKSNMIRMASHDLRNPLTQVSGYLDMMVQVLAGDSEPNVQPFVTGMQRGVEHMNLLLTDILNLERIATQSPDTWLKIDIVQALRLVIVNLGYQAERKGQQFEVSLPKDPVSVIGNETLLGQAAANFVENAIKYTPDGGKVTVRGFTEKDQFNFEVEDTGYGIPEARQARLFEHFYRAHTPGTEDIPGTGLGLSLVKTIVNQHGGEVFFKSEEGAGSTFGFRLPLSPLS